jgi:hypothetical protein
MTALNTTSGLTATLVGLLFTFVGASVLAWFKPEVLKEDERAVVIKYIGAVSAGLLMGLFGGFVCRFVDEATIQPWLAERRDKPAAELRAEFKKIQEQFEAAKDRNPTADEWKKVEKALERVETLLEKRSAAGGASDTKNGRPSLVFTVHAGESANAAAEAIHNELSRDSKKFSEADRQYLDSLRHALLKKDPQNHVTPAVVRRVRDMIAAGQLSTEARDAITAAITW